MLPKRVMKTCCSLAAQPRAYSQDAKLCFCREQLLPDCDKQREMMGVEQNTHERQKETRTFHTIGADAELLLCPESVVEVED